MITLEDCIKYCEKLVKPPKGTTVSVIVTERVSIKGKCNGLHFTELALLQFSIGSEHIGSVTAIVASGNVVNCIDWNMKEACRFSEKDRSSSRAQLARLLLDKMHTPTLHPTPPVAAPSAAAAAECDTDGFVVVDNEIIPHDFVPIGMSGLATVDG